MQRFFLFIFLTSFLFIPKVQSAHIIGGMMSYEFISTSNGINKYRITIRVFRDCQSQGADFDQPAGISIATSEGSYIKTNENFSNPTKSNLTNLFSNPCLVLPPNVCVQEGVYTKIIDLPVINLSYYIIYQRCCRNNSIFNIMNPGDVGATYYTEITPLAQQLQNSSPTFKTIPPIAVCGNFSLQFDHSGFDKDGDSLAYYFVAPIIGGGPNSFGNNCDLTSPSPDCLPPYDSVTYRPPFTSRFPMGGAPAISIDSKTGLLTGLPNAIGQFVVGVRIDEYRNGVLLSSSIRDFQFNVTNCEKVIKASIETDDVSGRDIEFKFCGDEYVKIDNKSTLASSIFNYSWNVSLNGKDSIYTTKDLDLSKLEFGNYTGTMILNKGLQCTDTAFFKFNKFPGIDPDFSFLYDTCKDNGVKFENLSMSQDGLALMSNWQDKGVSFSTSQDAVYGFKGPGDYEIKLTLSDSNQCIDSVTRIVPYYPIPDKVLEMDNINGCVPALISFVQPHPDLDDSYKITWDFGDGNTGEGLNPEHIYSKVNDYDISIHVVDAVGCVYDGFFSKAVRVHDVPEAGFGYSPNEVSNIKPDIQIEDESNNAVRWQYELSNGDILQSRNPAYIFSDTGIISIKQLVTNLNGCKDSISLFLDVVPINTIFLPNAFLPSTQGESSTFRPAGNGFGIKDYQMSVYDRYGEEIFTTHDWNIGWNGMDKNGKALPNGNYVVRVHITGPREVSKVLQGTAMLLR